MTYALRIVTPKEQQTRSDIQRSDVLQRVFSYIDEHFAEQDISLLQVAKSAHYSSAYLTTLVKETTGQSVRQWIIERRISAARRILATSDDDLRSIAASLGFGDVSYFCRCFARVTGSTPGRWRTHRQPLRLFRSVNSSAFFWYATQIDYAAPQYALVQSFRENAQRLCDVSAIARAATETIFSVLSPALAQFMWHDETNGMWVSGYLRSRRQFAEMPQAGDTFGAYPTLLGGQTICAHRLEHEENCYYRLLAKLGFHSLIATPVLHQERCLGALIVLESRERFFTRHEQSLMHLLGRYAGPAIAAAGNITP